MKKFCDPFTNKVKASKDIHCMKDALSAIAQEVQRFCTPQAIDVGDEIFERLNTIKATLTKKNKQLKKLNNNFKTAYAIARMAMSAKDEETAFLSKHIQNTRNKCECLVQKNKNSTQIIEDLKLESEVLKDDMKAIEILINLGYTELQKMRNRPLENISLMQKLREIMISCGQYYSNFYNEYEKGIQLEQKNRFLTIKNIVLTNSVAAMSEELKVMRTHKMRLQVENEALKKKLSNAKPTIDMQKVACRRSFDSLDIRKSNNSESILNDDSKCKNKRANLNFGSHLLTIKRLLDDQDDMLKTLKKISEELTIHENVCL